MFQHDIVIVGAREGQSGIEIKDLVSFGTYIYVVLECKKLYLHKMHNSPVAPVELVCIRVAHRPDSTYLFLIGMLKISPMDYPA